MRFELDAYARLASLDAHALAALYPSANHAADPVEDLVPARFELGVIEAAQAALGYYEYGFDVFPNRTRKPK